MKHFVTLAVLLTSLSAFAQLPYNPDANNDGQIGAFDLTSLLSVYSTSFSNGVLGEGTEMAFFNPIEIGNGNYYYLFETYTTASHWIVDLSLVQVPLADDIAIQVSGGVNGVTLTILKPTDWTYNYISLITYLEGGEEIYGALTGLGSVYGRCMQLVFWNGEWLPLTDETIYNSID